MNEVTVRWPIPEFQSSAALKKAVQDMCAKKFPEFYPVFGEIHSFTASRGQAVSTTSRQPNRNWQPFKYRE
jgi:hypothetical protein